MEEYSLEKLAKIVGGDTLGSEDFKIYSIEDSSTCSETSICYVKDEKYINDLNGYGWGLGFRILMKNTETNQYGNIGEFGWSGYASTFFLVDPINEISAVLMMQIIDGDRILKQDFYDSIFKNLDRI